MMARITGIPVELLQNIVLLIDGSALECTRVCWKFNKIATPVLYRSVEILSDKARIRFPILLKTIIRQPCLGEYVRSVHIALVANVFPVHRKYHLDFGPDDILTWTAMAASYHLSQEAQQALENGCPSAMLFLLLFYLPALHELCIFALPHIGIISQEILHANPLPSGLQSVRCVGASYACDFPPLIPFLSLPALDTFILWNSTLDEVRPDDTAHLLPCSSNVEHIKLSYCVITDSTLETLVRSSRSLRTLSFKRPGVTLFGGVFHAPSLGSALRECALSTLEHLELNFFHLDTFEHTRSLGPLSDFVHLTQILASLSSLLDYPLGEKGIVAARRLSETP